MLGAFPLTAGCHPGFWIDKSRAFFFTVLKVIQGIINISMLTHPQCHGLPVVNVLVCLILIVVYIFRDS